MSISRADIAIYLDTQFSSLAAAIEQNVDLDAGYEPDIDNALRKLGTVEADLATATLADADRAIGFALAEYYAARRIYRQLASRINFTADGSQFNYQYVLQAAKTLMDEAEKLCAALGVDITPPAPVTSTSIPASSTVRLRAAW
jgi:hypothetical protein